MDQESARGKKVIPFEWIIQAALAIFMVAFLIQVEAFWTVLYIAVCVYVIMIYGLGTKMDGPFQLFRIWITTGAIVMLINYVSNVFAKSCHHGGPSVGEEQDHNVPS
jgi:type IV secretory pathway TrbL component